MKFIYSFLSIIAAFLPIIGAFVAGWFIATDKNRNELFKQKLESYRKLSAQISKVYTLGYSIDKIEIDNKDSVYKKEAASLLNMLFSEAIFLEKSTFEQISKFIHMKPAEYLQNKEEINTIIDTFRNDLRLNQLNVINQLSSLKLDVKRVLNRPKN